MDKVVTIGGINLAFDMLDADTAERYEQALATMSKAADSLNNTAQTLSESIRSQCRAIFDFFNIIFGEGTDKKLFGDTTNLGVCMDAYDQVIDAANSQRLQYERRVEKYYTAARAAR